MCKRVRMIDRRVITLGEWVKLWYGSRVCATLVRRFYIGMLLDVELEQTGTVCIKEGDVGRESSGCTRFFRVGDWMRRRQVGRSLSSKSWAEEAGAPCPVLR